MYELTPHIAMKQVVTTYTKDGDGEAIGMSSTIRNKTDFFVAYFDTGLRIATWNVTT